MSVSLHKTAQHTTPAMTPTEIRTLLNAQYDFAHALHLEASRVAEEHGQGFLNEPRYMILDTAIAGTQAALAALRLLVVS